MPRRMSDVGDYAARPAALLLRELEDWRAFRRFGWYEGQQTKEFRLARG